MANPKKHEVKTTERADRAPTSEHASLADLALPEMHTVRAYNPPQRLHDLPTASYRVIRRDVAELIQAYQIQIKPSGVLSMQLGDTSPYDFFAMAKPVCIRVFGPFFSEPTAVAFGLLGTTYSPPRCSNSGLIEFPLDAYHNLNNSRFPDVTLLPLGGIDLQVAYTALSLVRADYLLQRFKSPQTWWSETLKTGWMQELRASEIAQRPAEFKLLAEGRDPAARSIRYAIDNGHYTQRAIANATKIPLSTLRRTLVAMGCDVRRIKCEHLDQLLNQGERDIGHLCETLDLEPHGLWELFHEKKRQIDARTPSGEFASRTLDYAELEPHRHPPELEKAVLLGKTLEEIGSLVFHGATREFARQQLEARNLNELRMRQRERLLECAHPREASRSALVRVLTGRALAAPASEAERLAALHALGPSTRRTATQLLPRYEAIVEGLARGDSLATISKALAIPYPTLQAFVRRSPIKVPGFPRKHAGYIDYDVYGPRVARCFELGFSLRSIERFLNRRLTKYQGAGPATLGHDYHTASQVYEAEDLGFKKEEIADLLGIHQRFASRLLYRRDISEPRIIEGLRVLFDDPSITGPYLRDTRSRD